MGSQTSPHDRDRRLRLDLVVQAEPVQGRIVDEKGHACTFVGWLELVELIEQHRTGRHPA